MLEKFKSSLKREILYYLITLLVLSIIMHMDLLTDPASRFEAIQAKENYFHPFLYAFIVYGIMFVLRKIIDFIVGIFQK